MVTQILLHTPLWVWGLFAGLLALGVWQSRPRRLAPAQLLVLPAVMGALGLASSAAAFGHAPGLALVWALALGLGVAAGRRLAPPARWDGQRLHLGASWWPLAIVLAIFVLRYVAAVVLVMHPAWRLDPRVMVPLTALYGMLGGLFAGRALALWRRTRGTTIAPDAAAA